MTERLRGEVLDARINDVLSNGLKAYEGTGISFRALADLIGCDPKTLRYKKEALARIQAWRDAHPTPQDRSYQVRIERVVCAIERMTESKMIFSVNELLRRNRLTAFVLGKKGPIKSAYDEYLKIMEVEVEPRVRRAYWPATLPKKEVVIGRVLKFLAHENLDTNRICRKLGVELTGTHREALSNLLQQHPGINVLDADGKTLVFYLRRSQRNAA